MAAGNLSIILLIYMHCEASRSDTCVFLGPGETECRQVCSGHLPLAALMCCGLCT